VPQPSVSRILISHPLQVGESAVVVRPAGLPFCALMSSRITPYGWRRAPSSQGERQWSRTRAKLADAVTTRGERLAAKELTAVAGLEAYVASAKSVIEGELGDIEEDTQSFGVQNETQRFLVSQYERGMDSGTLDTQAPDAVDVSGMLEESGGHSAFRWLPEDFEPQDTTGVPASGTGAAGGGGEGNA
jgi:hypothetical protein